MPWIVLPTFRACVSRQLLIHNHKIELTKFEIRVLLKHYLEQDYKASAAARKICEVEGDGVVNERIAQRWFQRFNTGEENTKDWPLFGPPKLMDIQNIRRSLEENSQKKKNHAQAVRRTWCIKRYHTSPG